jgi:glycosyltransferase involved in cell wall biosynthesis
MPLYKAAIVKAGKPIPAAVPIIKEMHVAKTREEAIKVAQPYLEGKYQAYADWGQDKALPGQESFRVPFEDLAKDRFILGSVEDVIQQIEKHHHQLGINQAKEYTNDADRQLIAERYLVTYPFLLYAGRISPHKNLVRIIEAFSALRGELEKEGRLPDLKLIIIGDDLSSHPDLRRTVIRSGVHNDVRFFGFVPIDILRIFYDLAVAFIFPSLYEGFGLPPLEAMAHGTPVVTSNMSSLPEVVGNAAVLVNPENVFEIMRATHRVLVDQALREKLKLRGYERAKHFSWDQSARQILRIYKEVAGTQRDDDVPTNDEPEIQRMRA